MSTRKIEVISDPYDCGFSTCCSSYVHINSGLTVLVGCNGSGKTTMLMNIQQYLDENSIPYLTFNENNLSSRAISKSFYESDYKSVALMMSSSEGEKINISLVNFFKGLDQFLKKGRVENYTSSLWDAFSEYKVPETKERWILMDSVDSGHSLDNVEDFKACAHDVVQYAEEQGYNLYLVCTTNSYELAKGETCMDVTTGKYLSFSSYEEYREFVLGTRRKRDRRYDTLQE